MKSAFLILLLLANIGAYCGPNHIICDYEGMFEEYHGGASLDSLVHQYFTGKALSVIEERMLDDTRTSSIFHDHVKSVISTILLHSSATMKKIKRVTVTVAVSSIGAEPVSAKQTLVYVLKKVENLWKISEIRSSPSKLF